MLKNEEKMIYKKSYSYPEAIYINMLIFLTNVNFPVEIIRTLKSKLFLKIFNNRISKQLFILIPYTLFINVAGNILSLRNLKQSAN